MKYWYKVQLRATYPGHIGDPISAEVVDSFPRCSDRFNGQLKGEVEDYDEVVDGIYERITYCATLKEANFLCQDWLSMCDGRTKARERKRKTVKN